MEAKEFLRQYQSVLVDIRNMEAAVEELEEMAMKATGHIEIAKVVCGKDKDGKDLFEERIMERVQSSGSNDSMASTVARICDIEMEIMLSRTVALGKLKEIRTVIQRVENKDYRQLLHRRYIEGDTWEKIAVAMEKTWRWIITLHGRALKDVQEILDKKVA